MILIKHSSFICLLSISISDINSIFHIIKSCFIRLLFLSF
nr:MAG TPA: hypothetical protein [Caudoviricetes sp.]